MSVLEGSFLGGGWEPRRVRSQAGHRDILPDGVRFRPFPFLLAVAGCSALAPLPPPPLEVLVRIDGDPGQPIKGAALLFNGQKVSQRGEGGVAHLTLTGKDGGAPGGARLRGGRAHPQGAGRRAMTSPHHHRRS